MSQVIRISDIIYKRLENNAEGFDTPANVIMRLLDFWEQHHKQKNDYSKVTDRNIIEKSSRSQNEFTLKQLNNIDITNKKPFSLKINDDTLYTNNWADLCVKFVNWIYKNGYLTLDTLPIINAGARDKYFINSRPEHALKNKDGDWKKVADGMFVDIKYNAKNHVKNILCTINTLELTYLNFKICIRNI